MVGAAMQGSGNSGLPAFDLSGRSAVIAGAASDIGAAIGRVLAAAGARLVLGDVDADRLAGVAEALERDGAELASCTTDVTRREDLEALVGLAGEAPDVMVNLAGVIHDGAVVDLAEAEIDRLLAVNVKGVLFGCQAAARAMVARGRGSIVNMASSGAYGALPGLSLYGMSKAAVVSLTRTLAAEVGPSGVRVNAVAPGYVEGGMSARGARRDDGSVDEEAMATIRERTRQRMPLRVLGTPEDVANAVLYLASDAARTTTGQVLHPNAGRPMGS